MRIYFVSLLALLFLSGCVMPKHSIGLHAALEEEPNGKNHLSSYRCTRGAHRGDSYFYTENTARAIHSARHNPKFAFIEFDVQYSADDLPVVVHDTNLRRVFGERAKVGECTYAELQQLSNHQISTYEEIMELAKGKALNIEIKSQGDEEEDERLVDFIVADLQKRNIEKRVLISSISEEAVRYVKDQYPEMATGKIFFFKASTYLPFEFLTEGLYEQIAESKADYLMLHKTNRHNIKDLLKLKPDNKTLVFWSFDDTMYIVHKDFSDRLWGDGGFKTFFNWLRYKTSWRRSKS
jgi:glycerophosphoryl diester phosphodiesterase